MSSVHFSIYRYNPETDKKPYMQDFELDVSAPATSGSTKDDYVQRDMMLLEALIKIKDEQDETLTFRRSCREGVCGSDGMNINGKNGLACIIPILALKQPIVVRPLPAFPVIRDLIVDMTQFFKQYEKVKPYLINNETPPAQERLQSPAERAKLDGLYECILCACCTSSCPSYWWNPEKYIGPAGLLWADRFIADSRDTMKQERLEELQDPFSLFRCRGIMNCTYSCPKGLNPLEAISDIRSQMLHEET